jgi:hypothetical protein
MSELREAAQAVLNMLMEWHTFMPEYVGDKERPAVDRLRSALAQPETEAQPEIERQLRCKIADLTAECRALRLETAVRPPRDEWREAVLGALDICLMRTPENSVDPERAMSDLMAWEPRDATPPTTEGG